VTVFGHDEQIATFLAAMAGARMHHGWLITGPKGIGKARFADMAARRLLAEASGIGVDEPGLAVAAQHPTSRLMDAGSHPDFKRLERLINEKTGALARNITVDQVRALRSLFATGTSMGARRVILVDAIDDMERGAANALLKSLEEPPASTIFLLVSHVPGRLLPTIRSRCRTLAFSPLNTAAMTSFLDDALPDVAPADRQRLVSGGIPATALSNAMLDMGDIEQALSDLAETGDPNSAMRSALAQSLALKAALPRYEAFLKRVPTFIAERARQSHGTALEAALDAWAAATSLAQVAIPQSLIAEAVVFEMAGHVAALAPRAGDAKA
jgi:DNA polymerase III subunit delta'